MEDTALAVGDEVTREDVRARFGGTTQGAISPSKTTSRIMLFAGEAAAAESGVVGWGSDGCFHFMGAGAHGDQVMRQTNRSLAMHKEEGRELHLFIEIPSRTTRKMYRYVGQFELAPEESHYWTDAPDTSGAIRSVVVFRLSPVGEVSTHGPRLPVTPAQEIAIEEAPFHTVRTVDQPHRISASLSATRRESWLVSAYARYLQSLGRDITSVQIRIPGETYAPVVDLLDTTENRLIEVKGQVTRQAVRTALAQLLDYRRFLNPTPRLAILLPAEPRRDLIDLCASMCIEVIWPDDHGGFVSSDD
ncbi:restriction endonuclease [Streptomyces sp. NPDC047968]|uniref:restriction endonuclease n=1 Tax=unclassified Streptomyces TaxID=2593676 RepID=UPI00343AB3A5